MVGLKNEHDNTIMHERFNYNFGKKTSSKSGTLNFKHHNLYPLTTLSFPDKSLTIFTSQKP